jgi:hypothetical protein
LGACPLAPTAPTALKAPVKKLKLRAHVGDVPPAQDFLRFRILRLMNCIDTSILGKYTTVQQIGFVDCKVEAPSMAGIRNYIIF